MLQEVHKPCIRSIEVVKTVCAEREVHAFSRAVKVVGVRSAYMTADGCQARENDVEGFKAVFGEVEEVADEPTGNDLEVTGGTGSQG